MREASYTESSLEALKSGKVPENEEMLQKITVGVDFLSDFLLEQYLDDYIPRGGSKMKFISGRSGSGKTHLSRILLNEAEKRNFITVHFSARDVWLHDFKDVYLEILRQSDLERILRGCAMRVVREMGMDPAQIPEKMTLMDYLAEQGKADPISKSTIRGTLRELFSNPRLDNNFAICCSLLTGGILGHPLLESQNRELLWNYLHGDKTVSLAQLRSLGLSPSRISKYNARHMLRSLTELIHLGGFAGLIVVIDDLEVLLNRSSADAMKYTKLRREDTYESIRQLIDDIDSMRYLMFFFCMDRELMDDDSYGFKSYQALWMRVQNEVIGQRFNCFADIIDLDRLGMQVYTPEMIRKMASALMEIVGKDLTAQKEFSLEEAEELRERASYGGLGIPCLVNRAVMESLGEGDKV